jgi:hypothetical protein
VPLLLYETGREREQLPWTLASFRPSELLSWDIAPEAGKKIAPRSAKTNILGRIIFFLLLKVFPFFQEF